MVINNNSYLRLSFLLPYEKTCCKYITFYQNNKYKFAKLVGQVPRPRSKGHGDVPKFVKNGTACNISYPVAILIPFGKR